MSAIQVGEVYKKHAQVVRGLWILFSEPISRLWSRHGLLFQMH